MFPLNVNSKYDDTKEIQSIIILPRSREQWIEGSGKVSHYVQCYGFLLDSVMVIYNNNPGV